MTERACKCRPAHEHRPVGHNGMCEVCGCLVVPWYMEWKSWTEVPRSLAAQIRALHRLALEHGLSEAASWLTERYLSPAPDQPETAPIWPLGREDPHA